jgi:hypothetical protein
LPAQHSRPEDRFRRWLIVEGELEVAPTDGIEISTPPE